MVPVELNQSHQLGSMFLYLGGGVPVPGWGACTWVGCLYLGEPQAAMNN